MLFGVSAGLPPSLIQNDLLTAASIAAIPLFGRLYPMRNCNTLSSVDRSSRLWDGITDLPYESGSAYWQARGVGATAYTSLATNIHRQAAISVALALQTSSAWCTGETSSAWPYKANIVAAQYKYMVQNYGALIKPYCENPQIPLKIMGATGTVPHYLTEAVCIAISPTLFQDEMYISASSSAIPPIIRLTQDSNYTTASFAMTNGYIGVDTRTSLSAAISNFNTYILTKNSIYPLRYVSGSFTGPVCGFVDCTTGLIAFSPVVRLNSLNYTCAPCFADTSIMPFPMRGAIIGTTFYKQTGSTVFTSFNEAMATGSETKIGDSLRNDIRSVYVSATTFNSHIDYLLTLPAQRYFCTQQPGTARTHVLLRSGSTTIYQSSSVRAACSYVGLFSEQGLMLGYAAFPTTQTFVYTYSNYYSPILSQSNANQIVARLYLS